MKWGNSVDSAISHYGRLKWEKLDAATGALREVRPR